MTRHTDPDAILAALAAPFGPDEIDWRVGHTNKERSQGAALAYQDARTAMDRLDEVCGALWTCTYEEMKGGRVLLCKIGIKLAGEWIFRTDGGDAGSDSARDADMEYKEALSDAFKRAAVRWGVGRFLYGFESPWIKVVPAGEKSVAIAKEERPRLRQIAEREVRKLGWSDKPQRPIPPRDAPPELPPPPAPSPAAVEALRRVGPPVAPAPLAVSIARLAEAAGTGGDSVDALTLAFGVERQKLPPEQWEPLELAYVEQVVKVLERLEGASAARDIERVVGFLNTAQLSRDGAPRKRARAAVAAARARCT